MAGCMTLLFLPSNTTAFFWIVLILKLAIVTTLTWLGINYFTLLCKVKQIPRTKLGYLCGAATALYICALWVQTVAFPFVYQSYYAAEQDNTGIIDKINKKCDIDLEFAVAIERGIFTFLGANAYLLTFVIYYIRLEACFAKSAYSISKCVKIFFYVVMGYVISLCFLYVGVDDSCSDQIY